MKIVVHEFLKHRIIATPGYLYPIRSIHIERKNGRKWSKICSAESYSDAIWAALRLEWPKSRDLCGC